MDENNKKEQISLPILPLRDVVVFPNMVIPLFVGREKSINALDYALEKNKLILLLAQKDHLIENPKKNDLYKIGTIANIIQVSKLADGSVKAIIEGINKAKAIDIKKENDFLSTNVEEIKDEVLTNEHDKEVWFRAITDSFEQLINNNKKIPSEILNSINEIEDLNKLIDIIASQIQIKIPQKQNILELTKVKDKASALIKYIENEIDILQTEKRIRGQVKQQMDKSQREYYLNEQVKAIQKELGDDNESSDLSILEKKILDAKMSKEAEEKALQELKKLKMMHSMSPESNVIRSYIDVLINLPWHNQTKINKNLILAKEKLEQDHFGLEKIKERILEFLSVQKRVNKIKGSILCLVGPPGVGKTSLGKSIAAATGRKYVRIALGGVHDEAEIRGHRRTYLGSMPGKILQCMTKAGVKNPLFLLDEIDKMGQDFRGDPASALLEVLDPEQNNTFSDHYAEIEYDLSNVMFIATSNTLKIPPALLDRMEIIRLSGYTEDEKINIAKKYLIPKQIEQNGVKRNEIQISENSIKNIIRYYTLEAGVRSLEREIAKLCRKVVIKNELPNNKKDIKKDKVMITEKNLHKYLGVRKIEFGKAEKENRIGQVTGLAWTEVGGELLTIEALALPGKGNIIRTGKLGDVMLESITASISVVRSRCTSIGINKDFYKNKDLHIHVPEGAIPKDGPSAGIAMTLAIVSSLTNIAVKADVAMTGEITLRGEILPIGGLKEKLLAALRGGIKHVLIPKNNEKDLVDIPDNVIKNLHIKPVKWIDEVIDFALEKKPNKLIIDDDLKDKNNLNKNIIFLAKNKKQSKKNIIDKKRIM